MTAARPFILAEKLRGPGQRPPPPGGSVMKLTVWT